MYSFEYYEPLIFYLSINETVSVLFITLTFLWCCLQPNIQKLCIITSLINILNPFINNSLPDYIPSPIIRVGYF